MVLVGILLILGSLSGLLCVKKYFLMGLLVNTSTYNTHSVCIININYPKIMLDIDNYIH